MALFFKPVIEKAPDLIQAIKDDIVQYQQLLKWCQAEKLPDDFEWGEILMGASRGLCSWFNDLSECGKCPLRFDDPGSIRTVWCFVPWHKVENLFWYKENTNSKTNWKVINYYLPKVIGKLQEVLNGLITKEALK